MLAAAVINADRHAIINLIKAGADPNKYIPEAGSPALMTIIRHFTPPKTDALEALLDAGYDPNQLVDKTPFFWCVINYNHWKGLKLMLKRGANINALSSWGGNFIDFLGPSDTDAAMEFIKLGADPTIKLKKGATFLERLDMDILNKKKKYNLDYPQALKKVKGYIKLRNLIHERYPAEKTRTKYTDDVEKKIKELRPILSK